MNLSEKVNSITGDVVITVILILLAILTILDLLCYIGFLPRKVRYFLKRGNFDIMHEALQNMGIDVCEQRRINFLYSRPWHIHNAPLNTIKKGMESLVEARKKKSAVTVGQGEAISHLRGYFDLMGALCDYTTCENVARYLNTFIREWIKEKKIEPYDFIVTPNLGSPLLGYELAKLQTLPFVIHENKPRYELEKKSEEFEAQFCCVNKPDKGKRALVVDDSMTSGKTIGKAISDLKRFGYTVSDCVVVFNVADGGGMEYLKSACGTRATPVFEVFRSKIKDEDVEIDGNN